LNQDVSYLYLFGPSSFNLEKLKKVFYINSDNTHDLEGKLLSEQQNDFIFDGVVFAWGIGGVRPAKMNAISFVKEMFEANVYSFLEICRVLLRKRKIAKGGSIVALSSVSSIKGLKSKSVYSASKAALDAAVRGLAAELSTKKIRVNSIRKGWVSSDMNLSFIETNRSISKEEDLDRQLLGPIHPKEIANLVCFLLSDSAPSLTGQSIVLDGGYTL
jgi:NAD(P)-dependent dehydrogenase (short-subunit alcohol dehydrogenase family)